MAVQSDNAATKDSFTTGGQPAQDTGYITATHHITDIPTGGVLRDEHANPSETAEETQVPNVPTPAVTPVKEPEVQPEVEQTEEADTPEAVKALNDFLVKQYGAGLEDIFTMMNDLGEFRNQQLIRQQEDVLRGEWGGDYDTRMEIVRQKFAELPDAHKAAYDNVEGARRLYAEYALQTGAGVSGRRGYVPPNPNPRRRMTPPNNQKTYDFKQSEILDLAMNNPREYDRRSAEITQAYQLGRVYYDS